MAKEFKPEPFKLYLEDDADILDFLEGRPRSYFIKEALRFYIKHGPFSDKPITPATPTTAAPTAPGKSDFETMGM